MLITTTFQNSSKLNNSLVFLQILSPFAVGTGFFFFSPPASYSFFSVVYLQELKAPFQFNCNYSWWKTGGGKWKTSIKKAAQGEVCAGVQQPFSRRTAASGIAYAALHVQRATGLNKYARPNGEKRYQYLSSLLPLTVTRSFHVPDFCLHRLVFTRGEVGCCSARINSVSICFRIKGHTQTHVPCCVTWRLVGNIFGVNCFLVGLILKEILKALREELQVPEQPRAVGGSSCRSALRDALRGCSSTDLQMRDRI